MAGLNKVMLIGNLGRDPEVRYTPSGLAVANFSIATTDRRKNKDGEFEDQTDWHRITAFGKLGEICGEYLSKGKQVYIEGRIKYGSYENKDGQTVYTTDIIASQMQMLGPRDAGASRDFGDASPTGMPAPPYDDKEDDDIPF